MKKILCITMMLLASTILATQYTLKTLDQGDVVVNLTKKADCANTFYYGDNEDNIATLVRITENQNTNRKHELQLYVVNKEGIDTTLNLVTENQVNAQTLVDIIRTGITYIMYSDRDQKILQVYNGTLDIAKDETKGKVFIKKDWSNYMPGQTTNEHEMTERSVAIRDFEEYKGLGKNTIIRILDILKPPRRKLK